MMTQAVREARTEEEIYLLLTAYIKATRLGAGMGSLLQQMTSLPLAGPDDVRGRIQGLFAGLGAASRGLDDSSRVAIKEALYVFCEAWIRLSWLARTQRTGGPVARSTDPAELFS